MGTDVTLSSQRARAASGPPHEEMDVDRLTAGRVITGGLAVAFVAGVAQIVTQVIDFQVFDLRIAALDSDVHASVFGIVSLVAQGAAALTAAVRSMRSDHRGLWLLLAAVLGVLLVIRAALPDHPTALATPLALVFVLFWYLTSNDSPRSRAVVLGGLALLVLSFIVHVVGPKIVHALGYGYNTWPYELKGIVKHSTEISGWTLAATGVLAGGLAAVSDTSVRRRRQSESDHADTDVSDPASATGT